MTKVKVRCLRCGKPSGGLVVPGSPGFPLFCPTCQRSGSDPAVVAMDAVLIVGEVSFDNEHLQSERTSGVVDRDASKEPGAATYTCPKCGRDYEFVSNTYGAHPACGNGDECTDVNVVIPISVLKTLATQKRQLFNLSRRIGALDRFEKNLKETGELVSNFMSYINGLGGKEDCGE